MSDDIGIKFNDSRMNETILIADDQDQIRELLKTVFSEIGYNVIIAYDGQDAVNKFKDHIDSIDIILMDVIMPRKNGVEAYKEICSLKPNVKIVFMSGYTANLLDELISKTNLVTKPISPLIIVNKIRETLDAV